MKKISIGLFLLTAVISGCATGKPQAVTDNFLRKNATAWPLIPEKGYVFTDNDAAFQQKIRLINSAQKSIDLIYYIYTDDESSSVFTKALLDAARRGVKVRLLVDYQTNYKYLDLYSMMEREGEGRLSVRLYNRPTANIVKDAVFMTMGCSKESPAGKRADCSAEKFAAIDKAFDQERIGGVPASSLNISNLDIGNSGLFLSGLYGKRGDVMAYAVQTGEGVDVKELKGKGSATTEQQRRQLQTLGKQYWISRTGGPFARLESKAELFFAFAMYGQQLNPVKETVTSVLPVDRKMGRDEVRDWDYFTDYTHHKLLLVDGRAIQMGGRNIGNSYHMHPNPLMSKDYIFMDTDIYAVLSQGGEMVAQSFDALWNFTAMVATLAEVRQHAPNDFVANLKLAEGECAGKEGQEAQRACVQREVQSNFHGLDERVAESARTMEKHARTYQTEYAPSIDSSKHAGFALDQRSRLAYLENLPYLSPGDRERTYGASVGDEAKGGKYIHEVWLAELPAVCAAATSEAPKKIILHNAYFFPASNLTYQLSRLVNGEYDCSHVTVTVLTNSIATTDLNVVNLAARHQLKAFTEFYQQKSDPVRRAKFDYYEYRKPASGANLSLHSKVSVFGDDVAIGSANADVRSFMMDTNNVMLIRGAAEFQRQYVKFVEDILSDSTRVQKLNDYFATTPRETMVQEDLATFRQIMAKYGVEKHMNAEEQKRVEARFVQMLNDAYTMTKGSINPGISVRKRNEIQNQFNEQFKPI